MKPIYFYLIFLILLTPIYAPAENIIGSSTELCAEYENNPNAVDIDLVDVVEELCRPREAIFEVVYACRARGQFCGIPMASDCCPGLVCNSHMHCAKSFYP